VTRLRLLVVLVVSLAVAVSLPVAEAMAASGSSAPPADAAKKKKKKKCKRVKVKKRNGKVVKKCKKKKRAGDRGQRGAAQDGDYAEPGSARGRVHLRVTNSGRKIEKLTMLLSVQCPNETRTHQMLISIGDVAIAANGRFEGFYNNNQRERGEIDEQGLPVFGYLVGGTLRGTRIVDGYVRPSDGRGCQGSRSWTAQKVSG
jgi:hypothetical protein